MSVPFQTFGAKQSYKVLDLLEEYSRRLQTLLDQFERLREERITVIAQLVLIGVTIFIAFIGPKYLSQEVIFPIIIAIGSIWFHSTVTSLRFFFSGRRKLKGVEGEIKMLIPKVERLLSVATQLEQHTAQDAGSRLDFDFRLSFCEETLKRAEMLIKSK